MKETITAVFTEEEITAKMKEQKRAENAKYYQTHKKQIAANVQAYRRRKAIAALEAEREAMAEDLKSN